MSRALTAALVTVALVALAPAAFAQADCSGFWVAPSGEIAASAGASGATIVVSAPVGCAFTVYASAGWIDPYPDAFTSQATETEVSLDWQAATGTERSATVGVRASSGETQFVTVRQAGACVYSVDTTYFEFQPEGGSGHFVVGTDDACAWTVTADCWITADGSRRTGTGLVEFTVEANQLSAGRGGALVIAETAVVSVVQSAAPDPDPYADDPPTPPSDDAGFIDDWISDSAVETPGVAWPAALAAVAAAALLARRAARGR